MFNKAKAGLSDAKDASKRAALRTKGKADLELLRRKLKGLKQDFGVEVFPFYSNKAQSDAIYESYRARIDEVAAAIARKQQEIEANSGKKPTEPTAGSGYAAAPPPPPPAAAATGTAAPAPPAAAAAAAGPSMSEI